MLKSYEAPKLQLVGSVGELTLQPNQHHKVYDPNSDGLTYGTQDIPINFS